MNQVAREPSAPASRLLIPALAFAIFAAAAGTHAITPLFPELKAALGVGDTEVRSLMAIYTVGYSLSGFVLGMQCDRIGRRRVLLFCLVLFAAANAGLYFATSFTAFFVLRAVAGVATGGISSAVMALAADTVVYARRGSAMSLVLSGSYAATVLGMPLASYLAQFRLGLIFPVLCAIALLALAILASLAPRMRMAAPTNRRRDQLLLALKSPGARGALAVTFLNTFAAFAVITSFADAAVDSYDASDDARAIGFLALGLASLCGAVIAHRFADRCGKRKAVVAALALSIVTLPLVLLPSTLAGFVASFSVVALVAAIRQGPFAAILTELCGPELRGTLAGWNALASGFGLAAGSLVAGAAYTRGGLPLVIGIAVCAPILALPVFIAFVRPSASIAHPPGNA